MMNSRDRYKDLHEIEVLLQKSITDGTTFSTLIFNITTIIAINIITATNNSIIIIIF